MSDAPDTGQTQPVPPPPPPSPPPPPQTPPAGPTASPGKPDMTKRFIAFLIDAVLAFAIGLIPLIGGLIGAAYWLLRDGMELDFMDGRSIGKKVVKLRPVRLDGGKMDIMTSVKRNWMFGLGGVAQLLVFTIIGIILAIPLAVIALIIAVVEVVLVLTDVDSRRMGDKIAGTKVIEVDS